MASGLLIDYLGAEVAALRPAAPVLHTGALGLWWSTDTLELSAWDGAAWEEDIGGGATPTGTGFTRITAGVQDAAAKLVDTADINNDQVTNAKLANMATATIKGRTTAGTGDPEDLTAAQAAAILQGDGLTTELAGYRGIPLVSFSANTTIAATHNGKVLYHPASDANARTVTIDANGTLALPLGFAFTVFNDTAQVVSIAITTDALVLAGTGTTGTRSLAQYGEATAVKVASTRWWISGVGLT